MHPDPRERDLQTQLLQEIEDRSKRVNNKSSVKVSRVRSYLREHSCASDFGPTLFSDSETKQLKEEYKKHILSSLHHFATLAAGTAAVLYGDGELYI